MTTETKQPDPLFKTITDGLVAAFAAAIVADMTAVLARKAEALQAYASLIAAAAALPFSSISIQPTAAEAPVVESLLAAAGYERSSALVSGTVTHWSQMGIGCYGTAYVVCYPEPAKVTSPASPEVAP